MFSFLLNEKLFIQIPKKHQKKTAYCLPNNVTCVDEALNFFILFIPVGTGPNINESFQIQNFDGCIFATQRLSLSPNLGTEKRSSETNWGPRRGHINFFQALCGWPDCVRYKQTPAWIYFEQFESSFQICNLIQIQIYTHAHFRTSWNNKGKKI